MWKIKYPLALAAVFVFVAGVASIAAGTAGTKNDPLITVSYFQQKVLPDLKKQVQAKTETGFSGALAKVNALFDAVTQSHKAAASEDEVAAALAGKLHVSNVLQKVSINAGETLDCKFGLRFTLSEGSVKLVNGALINLSGGTEVAAGTTLSKGVLYLTSENGAKLQASAASAAMLSGSFEKQKARTPLYTAYADALSALGLFQGTESGYSLERPATRVEGLVMLIRLLGEEKEALSYKGKHPFTDVPDWAQAYVTFAYEKGYTKGSTATTFGGASQMSAQEYMTFLLRALGYQDAKGDFQWDKALDKALEVGLILEKEQEEIQSSGAFYRDHIVMTSYQALFSKQKDGILLKDKLISSGVITKTQMDEAEHIAS